MMNCLYIIPARGGSKGIPRKNIKPLNGRPLIYYSIDVARELAPDEDICVSTDDSEIIQIVQDYGLRVPFIRPATLATDSATTNDVLIHVLNFYKKLGKRYDAIILLQPTSPLRKAYQVTEALQLFTLETDMVVSVKISDAAAVLCHENEAGFLEMTLSKSGGRRQELTGYYEYNGAIYIINVASLEQFTLAGLRKKVKYVMPDEDSVDIDTMLDWKLCEAILHQ